MSIPFCPGTTHYTGCDCHEAKRNAEIERLTKQRDLAVECAKFYGGKCDDAWWDLNRFVAIDKFGAIEEILCGPFFANQTLDEIQALETP